MASVKTGIATFARRQTNLDSITLDDGTKPLLADSYIRVNTLLAAINYLPANTQVCISCDKHLAVIAGVVKQVKQGDSWKTPVYNKSNARWQETRLTVATPQGAKAFWVCGPCSADVSKLRAACGKHAELAHLVDANNGNDVCAHIAAAYDMHNNRAAYAKQHTGIVLGFGAHSPFPRNNAYIASPTWPIDTYVARVTAHAAKAAAKATKTAAKTPKTPAKTPAKATKAATPKTPAKTP